MKCLLKNRGAFTLIEIILVLIIISILVGILFKTYITMSQIAFRIEQQKIINNELLFVSKFFQNLSNDNEIDYSKYGSGLVYSKGITNILYMSGSEGEISVFTSGACIGLNDTISEEVLASGCNLFLNRNGEYVKLTSDNVYFTEALFKIIPFADEESYLHNMSLCTSNYLACIDDPGFWFISNIYVKGFNKDSWPNNVSVFLQQFFNI